MQHHESGHYESAFEQRYPLTYDNPVGGHDTVRSITIPNLGGFAGISLRRGDAKVSFGYRADFFFGAMGGGIDVRRSETLGFKVPSPASASGWGTEGIVGESLVPLNIQGSRKKGGGGDPPPFFTKKRNRP